MDREQIHLTEAEWAVMECLWEQNPKTGREISEWLSKRMGWNRSTSLTLLRRLEAKGAVAADAEGERKRFRPMICREEAALQETKSLLKRVYRGSLSMMVSSLTQTEPLSRDEIQELYDILKGMEERKDG